MGRPIKSKYFAGKVIAEDVEAFVSGGYKGIGSVVIATSGTWYSQGATLAVSAPQWVDGTTATVSAVINTTTGWVSSISLTNAGDGYNSTGTVTVTPAATQSATGTITSASTTVTNLSGVNGVYVGMQVTGTGLPVSGVHVKAVNAVAPYSVTLSAAANLAGIYGTATSTATVVTFADTGTNAAFVTTLNSPVTSGSIKMTCFITTGSSAVNSAILKQESSIRYLVQNSQGRGPVKLASVATGSLAAGQANLIATDANGNTYYVYKLTGRKAYLTQQTQNGSNAWLFNSDSVAKWTTGTASTGVVSIATN